MARGDDSSIPKGRIRRTAQVGLGGRARRARATPARARPTWRARPTEAADALERRHLEAAERMVETLGRMKGAAMKIGQLASFIDTEFLPPEYRELYQEQLAQLRTQAPTMPWKKVRKVLDEEWDEPVRGAVRGLRARGRGGGLDRPGAPRRAAGRPARGGEDPVPGRGRRDRRRHAERRADPAHGEGAGAGARREGRGRGAQGARDGGARLRARGAEPALVRARLPRPPVHPRARRGHAAVDRARAGQRVGRRRRASRRSSSCRRPSATASARSSSASASARSSTCSTSTPTPTPATTC